MTLFSDNRPVFKPGERERSFDNCLYFYVRFTSNCPICLSYHEIPHVIPCGHSFCQECLTNLMKFSRNCPICNTFYWASKPAKFFFVEEIGSTIIFKRLTTREIETGASPGFFEYPYCCYYFERSEETASLAQNVEVLPQTSIQKNTNGQGQEKPPNSVFYQSADGQLYFLNPKITRNYRLLPEYIYGHVKRVYMCRSCECADFELGHIPPNQSIYIVDIHT